MNRFSLKKWMIAAAVIVCLPLFACAETVRVVTPGGKLNIRKAANEKSAIVTDVPNKSLVEVEEVGETWSRIVYKKKTGYVKTEYLNLPANLVGKNAYADEGTLLLRAKASARAEIVGVISCTEKVKVLKAENGWLQVQRGKTKGYVEALQLSYQRQKPEGTPAWIREGAEIAADCTLKLSAAENAKALSELKAGQAVTVTVIEGKTCLIEVDGRFGYVPLSAVKLQGVEDSGAKIGSLAPAKAAEKAAAALKKQFKAFAKARLYDQTMPLEAKDGFSGPLYHCGFYNEQDQYVYGALVNAKSGSVVFMAAYSGFAAPAKAETLLPAGEVTVDLSAEEIAVGEVMDVSVQAWTTRKIQYKLIRDGKEIASTAAGQHFTAAFRPKEAGEYTLKVTVTDAKGTSVTVEKSFRATGARGATEPAQLYSQKDGWWQAVPYGKSSMNRSGCAVFALAHALYRMGITTEKARPENLAKTYGKCLIPNEGTNNEWLIREAAAAFGFKTQRDLVDDEKEIVSLLRSGTMFSFRVARGHIAMIDGVSEDGSMVRVVDSAPGATFERIKNVSMYYRTKSGGFRAALALEEMPGARWYLDTEEWGGLEYWMPISYAVKMGVRLIQPTSK